MLYLTENNATISFIEDDIVHIEFLERGLLNTNFMRHLKKLFCFNRHQKIKAFVITAHDLMDTEYRFWKICRRAERFSQGAAIVIVAKSFAAKTLAKNYLFLYKPSVPYRVFDNITEALHWVNHVKIQSKNMINYFQPETALKITG
ncbi:MAG: hypothetical protein IPM74_12215 [Crocinitomicaceae bacterium]|nr:hypothetical protein [Crocinitomicaceae bacterium]MBK8926639.1 hypothetical protein [Crocinitomicaceae bacterium]